MRATVHPPKSSLPPPRPAARGSGRRALTVAVTGWVAANLFVVLTAPTDLPFDWPARANLSTSQVLIEVNVALVQVLLLMAVVWWLTRRRADPQVLERAPAKCLALRETFGLIGYGVLGMLGGFALARAFGWHPFGLHLAGTLFGTHAHLEQTEVFVWAGYNFVVYALLPLLYFRRQYTTLALGLRSSCRTNDLLVIAVVLTLETVFQLVFIQPDSLELPTGSLVRGGALTFLLYFLGAVLPAMVFIYAILIPRFLRITGSPVTTVLLGGLTYAGLHFWDAWTVLTSAHSATLSVIFLLLTYLGPGMIKSFMTLRTGNAWVHVWAYHAFAPHTLIDTPHIVDTFELR